MMRTTLTLDEDVAVALERLVKAGDRSFKAIVNDVLREGLRALDGPPRHRPAFHTHSVDLGRPRLASVDDIAEVLALGEGDAFR